MMQVSISPSPRQAHQLTVIVGGKPRPLEEAGETYDADPPTVPREPFAMIPAGAYDRLKGDGFALAVYAALAKYADANGMCWPKVETICEAVGWSKPTVIKALKRLREVGLVESETRWAKGSVTANAYRLPLHPPVNHVDSTGKPRLPVEAPSGQSGLPAPVNVVDSTGKPRLPELEPRELEPRELEGGNPPNPPNDDEPAEPEKPAKEPEYPAAMLAFWEAAHPKSRERSSKKQVHDQWKAIKPNATTVADIMAGLDAWNASQSWHDGYALGAHRFLKLRKWTERPAPKSAAPPSNGYQNGHRPPESQAEMFARMKDAAKRRAGLIPDGDVIETRGTVR